MAHKEYRRMVPGAKTAVLFLHGIVGSPDHFRPFLSLVPETMSAVSLLLEGHGKTAREFSRASMQQWEAQARAAVEELTQNHDRILLVGHSMGTLLALEQAASCEKIAGLFLLAVPLRLRLRVQMVKNAWWVLRGRTDSAAALAAKTCCGVEHTGNPLHYPGWLPRFWELLCKMRQIRRLLPEVTTPCRVFQSAKDEMVSRRSAALLRENPACSVQVLAQSGHYYYPPEDLSLLQQEFSEFIRQ